MKRVGVKMEEDILNEWKDFTLNESPIACEGDAEFGPVCLKPITGVVAKIYWNVIGHLDGMEIRRHKSTGTFIVGDLKYVNTTKESFVPVLYMETKSIKSKVTDRNGYKKVKQITGIMVHNDHRGKGIAKKMYKFLVNEFGVCLLSDSEQYFGARKLWASLSKEFDVVVDVLDIKNNVIMYKDIVVHHGNIDVEFDINIWSRDISKKDIRLIMTKVK